MFIIVSTYNLCKKKKSSDEIFPILFFFFNEPSKSVVSSARGASQLGLATSQAHVAVCGMRLLVAQLL